jgi:phage-related protein
MADKPICWIGRSKEELLEFSEDARRRAGFELWTLQQGDVPSDFKPMRSVGQGVEEIRIRIDGAYRIFYFAKFSEAIYVLHAFQKTRECFRIIRHPSVFYPPLCEKRKRYSPPLERGEVRIPVPSPWKGEG